MPFGLTNTPVTFQNYINDILAPYLDNFCTPYLDNTLIYLDNFQEHQQHILSRPVILKVYDLLRHDGILREIMVHHRSKSYGIITRHSTSPLGNSMSLTLLWFSTTLGMLGSDMGPYPCSMTKAWNLIGFGRLLRQHYASQTLHHDY
jgi:hypothetical protein